jgi:hypothetical protein
MDPIYLSLPFDVLKPPRCEDHILFYLFFRRDLNKRTTKKSTKEIGNMGYVGEEILLGGRLFTVLDTSIDKKFQVYIRYITDSYERILFPAV